MKTINENNLTITPEFGLAVALLSYGFTLEYLDRSDPGRVQFCFLRARGIDGIAANWWKKTLMVNARAYDENYRSLKARLRNEK